MKQKVIFWKWDKDIIQMQHHDFFSQQQIRVEAKYCQNRQSLTCINQLNVWAGQIKFKPNLAEPKIKLAC